MNDGDKVRPWLLVPTHVGVALAKRREFMPTKLDIRGSVQYIGTLGLGEGLHANVYSSDHVADNVVHVSPMPMPAVAALVEFWCAMLKDLGKESVVLRDIDGESVTVRPTI